MLSHVSAFVSAECGKVCDWLKKGETENVWIIYYTGASSYFWGAGAALCKPLRFGGKRFRQKKSLGLEAYVLGLTLINSLVLAWLILHFGHGQRLVLFRLFGNLTVMFCLDGMGKVFGGIIAFLWPLAVLYSFEYMRNETRKATFFPII